MNVQKIMNPFKKYVPDNFFTWLNFFITLTGIQKPTGKVLKLLSPLLTLHYILCCWIMYFCTLIEIVNASDFDSALFLTCMSITLLDTVLVIRITLYYFLKSKKETIIRIITRSTFNFDCFSIIAIEHSKYSIWKKSSRDVGKIKSKQLEDYWKEAILTVTKTRNEVDDYREQTMFHTRLLCCTLYITLAVICLFANLVWYIADADNEFYEAFNPYLNKTSLYKKSAFEIYLPFDTSNDGYIWLAFFIQYYSKLISVQMFIPFEILLTSFIIHLISQTMVVAEAFKHIHKHISPKQTAGRKFLIIEMRIIKCINELQEIYSAFNLVDAVCSVQMLIQYGCAILILCILCYMAPMLEKAGEIFGCVMFLIASLGEIFFFSYCSQTLTLELQKVAISIYGIQWETYPLKVQKHIKFLLKRLQKPAVLKAGKMFPIDLNFFNLILQKAYSFYTIINARQ